MEIHQENIQFASSAKRVIFYKPNILDNVRSLRLFQLLQYCPRNQQTAQKKEGVNRNVGRYNDHGIVILHPLKIELNDNLLVDRLLKTIEIPSSLKQLRARRWKTQLTQLPRQKNLLMY